MTDDLFAYTAIKEEFQPGGQCARLFSYLWGAGSMTHFDAETKCGTPPITVIRSRIPDMREVLERHGYTIQRKFEPNEIRGVHAVYHLVKLKTGDQRWRERIGAAQGTQFKLI